MDVTKQKRRPDNENIQLMEEFEKTGAMTMPEFCEAYEISNATFYNWQRIYRNRNQNDGDASGFLSLDVTASPFEQAEGSLFAEFKGLRFYKEVSASFLKELVS